MGRSSPIALGLLAAHAAAHNGHPMHAAHPPMSPMMIRAMHYVEDNCRLDVASLCPSPFMDMGSDPMTDWLMSPMVSSPMEDSLSSMLDSMMDTAVRLANEQPSYVLVSLQGPPEETPSEHVFDSMVSNLVENVASSRDEYEEEAPEEREQVPTAWDPVDFTKRLVDYGHAVLDEPENSDDRRRMARRLTEVHPDMFQAHHKRHHLPFGCHKNRCLMRAYEQGAVSPHCAEAIRHVEQLEQQENAQHMLIVEREKETFFGLAILYGVLCIGTLLLLRRRLSNYGRRMQGNRRLKSRILQAIYNNPELKAAVAAEINEDLGHVPPLAPHALARMGGEQSNRNWRMIRFMKLLVLTGVLVLAFVNPLLAMPVMCLLVGIRFFHLACCPTKLPKQSCCCCCCGLSTDDVAAGNVTAVQACCKCCNGTGVPCPSCTSRDDGELADGCTCCCCGCGDNCKCGDGCCCGCSGKQAPGKLTDGCTCCCGCGDNCKCGDGCCCGCSGKQASGKLTDGCTCCCGCGDNCKCGDGCCCGCSGKQASGKLTDGCTCCCGCGDNCKCGDGCCCGCSASSAPRVKQNAFTGVPVQIV